MTIPSEEHSSAYQVGMAVHGLHVAIDELWYLRGSDAIAKYDIEEIMAAKMKLDQLIKVLEF
jgi:hypothetical protein